MTDGNVAVADTTNNRSVAGGSSHWTKPERITLGLGQRCLTKPLVDILRRMSYKSKDANETLGVQMKVGYARTSTSDQKAGFEAQLRELEAVGCEKVFREQVSSVAERLQLEALLDFIREGDTLIVTKLDRLARSTQHLLAIADRVKRKGANLQVLNLGVDTATPTGKLMFTMIGAIAEFEREMMLERQREGIAKAKTEGKYKGRAPTARAKADEIRALHAQRIGATEIAKRLGIGRASVYRILETTAEGAGA